MSKPRAYAKRIIPPYSGVLQIVEDGEAKAVSLDGKTWEIQCQHQTVQNPFNYDVDSQSNNHYFRVARYTIEDGLYRYPLYPTLDPEEIYALCMPVIEHISTLELPLKIHDNYEYWLLDETEQKPLALLCSCRSPDELQNIPSIPSWRALSSVQIGLKSTEEEIKEGLTPPSDRLEKLVRKRAGFHPKACWFKRDAEGHAQRLVNGEVTSESIDNHIFPEFLVSEDWASEEDSNLCHRYLERISPRLLMLQRLSHAGRKRAEVMANAYALEVERYFKLYPEVADEGRMVAIRVEARLRRSIINQNTDNPTDSKEYRPF